jgi:hypothetical protein
VKAEYDFASTLHGDDDELDDVNLESSDRGASSSGGGDGEDAFVAGGATIAIHPL